MNANLIKQALLRVHMLERCSTRPQGLSRVDAYKAVITGSGMTSDECAVLRRALHIADDEVTES